MGITEHLLRQRYLYSAAYSTHTHIRRHTRTTAVPYTRASGVTETIEKISQTATKSKSKQFLSTNVLINNMNALRRRRNQMFVLHSCSSCSKQWRSSLRSAHRHWSVSWPGGMRITRRSADGLRSAKGWMWHFPHPRISEDRPPQINNGLRCHEFLIQTANCIKLYSLAL